MKIFSYIIAGCLLAGTTALTSCSSDYLDTTPSESVTRETTLSTAENIYSALNGIAKTMSTQQYSWTQGCAGENRIFSIYENYPSQNYLYNAYASGWAPIMNLRYSQRNSTSYDAYPWYYYYTIISQANTIIANVDNATGDDNLKNYEKAAALTFRAYAYEKLLHYYCPRWQDSGEGDTARLVLRLDESTGSQAASSMKTVYAQIYTDLDSAITLFSGSSYSRSSSEIWIPNINVAHAVYARAALTKQDYATALSHATSARSGYDLMSNSDYQAGFCKPTSEWIFGSYGDPTENLWYWSYGTQFSANGYIAGRTWYGAGQMNSALSDLFPDTDIRMHLFLTGDKIGWGDSTAVDLDGSTDSTAYALAVAYMDSIHAAYSSTYADLYAGSKASKYLYMGSQWKFLVFDTPGVGYLPFIRSSEMLLIEAEANYFLGNTSAAQANLVELNATSGRDASYTCTVTGDDLFTEIRNYRSLELWGEGFGFSDWKRWNLALDRTTGKNVDDPIKVTVAADNANWTWVIPQFESDYNDAFKNTASSN